MEVGESSSAFHLKANITGCYTCDSCNESFENRKSLIHHIKEKHTSLTINGEAVSSKHNKMYCCNVCNKGYCHNKTLLCHIRTEHNQSGSPGNKMEISKSSVTINPKSTADTQAVHYSCNICSRDYLSNDALQYHMRIKHINNGVVFQCEICMKIFSGKHILKRHLKMHQHKHGSVTQKRSRTRTFNKNNTKSSISTKHVGTVDALKGQTFKDSLGDAVKARSTIEMEFKNGKTLAPDIGELINDTVVALGENAERLVMNHAQRTDIGQISNACSVFKGIYNCDSCTESFINRKSLLCHIKEKHTSPKINGKNVSSKEYKIYSCNVCNKSYSHKKTLLCHIRTKQHQSESSGNKIEIGKSSVAIHPKNTADTRTTHNNTCSKIRRLIYSCNICSRDYLSNDALRYHMRIKHLNSGVVIQCEMCMKTFSSKPNLKRHSKIHQHKPDNATQKRSRQRNDAEDFMGDDVKAMSTIEAESSGNKIEIGKSSVAIHPKSTADTRTTHNNTCSKIRRLIYSCNICSRDYLSNDALRYHMRIKHINSGVVIQCEMCMKTFSSRPNLKRHLSKIHQHKPVNATQKDCQERNDAEDSMGDDVKAMSTIEAELRNGKPLSPDDTEHIVGTVVSLGENGEGSATTRTNSGQTTAKACSIFKGIYSCDTCNESFNDNESLLQHFRFKHTSMVMSCRDDVSSAEREIHRCDICNNSYTTRKNLLTHVRNQHSQSGKTFPCKICNKIFATKRYLTKHTQIHQRKAEKAVLVGSSKNAAVNHDDCYTCEKCGVLFEWYTAFKIHQRSHEQHSKKYACNVCGSRFATPHSLRYHRFYKHLIEEKDAKKYPCEVCGKIYIGLGHLNYHQKTIHSTERPFKCLCGKSFKKGYKLKRHQDEAHGCGRFGCKICGKVFTSKAKLKKHMVTHGEKQHACKVCGKCFFQRYTLSNHMNSHTGNRPYKCSVCDKGFTSQSARDRHMQLHTGEKCYKCDFCGMAFNQKCSLTRHVRLHTGEKPYKCELCGMSFTQGSSLTGHKKVYHGQEIPLVTEK